MLLLPGHYYDTVRRADSRVNVLDWTVAYDGNSLDVNTWANQSLSATATVVLRMLWLGCGCVAAMYCIVAVTFQCEAVAVNTVEDSGLSPQGKILAGDNHPLPLDLLLQS